MSEDIKGDRIRAALRHLMAARREVNELERAEYPPGKNHPAGEPVRGAIKAMIDVYIAHDPERAERAGLCTSAPLIGDPEDTGAFPTVGPMQ